MSDRAGALDRALALEVVHVAERAAIAAARFRGRGDEQSADQAAVGAMRRELQSLAVRGRIVIGEGEEGEAHELYIGEEVGNGTGPLLDIAVDPLEGTTICAKALSGALAVLAVAEPDTLLKVPQVYMEKIAIGPGYSPALVDLDAAPAENLAAIAREKGARVSDLTVCILDRPRHAGLIAAVREAGAAIRLIGDGDIAGVIQTGNPDETGIDVYMGIGGAPEGVLAAAALRCIGGQMQCRLWPKNDDDRRRIAELGIDDVARKYSAEEMVAGDVIFAATGVTHSSFLGGVRFNGRIVSTESVVMRQAAGSVRWIRTEHHGAQPLGGPAGSPAGDAGDV